MGIRLLEPAFRWWHYRGININSLWVKILVSMSLEGGVHLICSQTSFCNKNTAVGFVAGSQSIRRPLPPVPTVHPSAPRYAGHSRSLTKLPPKLDQRKGTRGAFITHRRALGAGVGSIFAGRDLSGPPVQALWDPAGNQSLQHTTA